MKIKSAIVYCSLLAGIIASIVGCAVMRIDVDVYKGPLANHEEVQAEQMAAMAIGAKPILVKLRDQLELSWYRKVDKLEIQRLQDLPVNYVMGYMQPEDLKGENAIRVNAILHLYEDIYDNELKPFIQRGKSELEAYKFAWNRFTDIPNATSEESWENLEKVMKKDTDIEELKKAYRIYLNPKLEETRIKEKMIVTAHKNLFKGNDKGLREFDPVKIFGVHNNGTSTVNEFANAVFGALTNEGLVKAHAKLLFLDNADKQKQLFIKRVTSIAQNFLDARQELRNLFRTILGALVVFGDTNTQRKDEAIQMAVSLIQTKHFRALINSVNSHKSETPECVKTLCNQLKDKWDGKSLKTISDYLLRLDLCEILEKDTSFTASALLKADNHFKDSPLFKDRKIYEDIGIEEKLGEFTTPEKRKFGLAGVPKLDLEFTEDMAERFAVIERGAAAGLESGRLNDGIDTLTKKYLETKAGNYKDNDESSARTEHTSRQLINVLVHFAEKVLVLANNETILKQDILKGILCGDIDTYTLVLQSIGNSILIQADELRHQAGYKAKIEKDRDREVRALVSAFSDDPNKFLNNIIYEVKSRKEDEEKKRKEIEGKFEKELEIFIPDELKDINWMTIDNFKTNTDSFYGSITNHLKEEEGVCSSLGSNKDKIAVTKAVLGNIKDVLSTKLSFGTTTPCEVSTIKSAIHEVLNEKLANGKGDSKEKNNLNIAIESLKEEEKYYKEIKSPSQPEPMFNEIYRAVYNDMDTKRKEWEKKCNEIKKIETIESLTKGLRSVQGEIVKYSGAFEKIKDARNDVLATVDNAKDVPSSSAVYWQLLANLQSKIKKTPTFDDDKKDNAKLEHAISVLEEIKPSIEIKKADVDVADVKSSKDVFDQLVATLRDMHINAVEQFGADSPAAKKYKDALDVAYNYRSGMVYIRPPSAYLRSSTPATSLQADPGLAWRNMLSEHAMRNMPFYDLKRYWDKKGKIIGEIDKQFWQNINSVRVAGAGRTNYVIAKDDVGNWYVKRYSSDPKDIIKSAQKLAMFNLGWGTQMNVDLVSRLGSKSGKQQGAQQKGQEETQQEGTQQKSEANRSTLERLFDKYKTSYGDKTDKAFETLKQTLEPKYGEKGKERSKIEESIYNSWSKNKDITDNNFISELGTSLLAVGSETLHLAYNKLIKREEELNEKQKKKETPHDEVIYEKADEIINSYHSINQFRSILPDRISYLGLTKPATGSHTAVLSALEKKKSELDDLKNELEMKEGVLKSLETEIERLDLSIREVQGATGTTTSTARLEDLKLSDVNKKGTLTTEINNKNGSITTKVDEITQCEKELNEATKNMERAKSGEQFATREVSRIVVEMLTGLLENRIDTVGDYEMGIMFIGDAIKEKK